MCVYVCMFSISQDFPVRLALSHLPLKSSFYISTRPICGIDGFLLTFILTLMSASISIYYPCVSASPLQHNRSVIGGWWKTVGLKALTGVVVRCCFLGICMDSDFKGCAVLWSTFMLFLSTATCGLPFMMPPAFFLSSISSFSPPLFLYLTTTILTSMQRKVPLPPAPPLPLLILLPLCAYLLF